MTFKFKAVVAAIALGAAAVGAHASDASVLIADQAWSFVGVADDYFNFTITTPGAYNLNINATTFGSTSIDSLMLYEGPGLVTYVDGTSGGAVGGFYNWTVNITHAGTYALNVDVTPNALYAGTIVAASAVPEPESYAMMLAGLGALGFMARRRKVS